MIVGVHHVAISTPRTATAQPVLADILALRPTAVPDAPGRLLAGPNVYLLTEDAAAPGSRRPPTPEALGVAHLCLQSPDAASLWESLCGHAVAWTAPLTGLGGPFRYAYGYSPDGLMWELEETPAAPLAGPRAWLAHLAFVTRDLLRLAGFYARLLQRPLTEGATLAGSRRADRITGLTGVAMTPAWVHGLNLGLEFWRFDAPAPQPAPGDRDGAGLAALCLQTDDLRADLASAIEAGATLAEGPHTWAGGVRARLHDPDGNALHLLHLPADHSLDIRGLPHVDILARHARAMEALA